VNRLSKSKHVLLIADIGYASPYWLDYCRILHDDFGFEVKVISPKMNYWQKKFFDIGKAGSVEIVETKTFPMFYRRLEGMPRNLRRIFKFVNYAKVGILNRANSANLRSQNTDHRDWVQVALDEAMKLNKWWEIDVVISTCLPFETHETANHLNSLESIPWIADYRDPYSFSHTRKTPADNKTVEHEKKIISSANVCTTTSLGFSHAIQKVYTGPIHVIHNGFDDLNLSQKNSMSLPIEILYQGSIYQDYQDVSIVLDALDLFYESHINLSGGFPITITFGGFSTHVIDEFYSLKSRGIPSWVKLQGVLDFKSTQVLQKSVDFLLLLNWEDFSQPGVMQTKLYEYISSGTPIISTGGSSHDETFDILSSTMTAHHFMDSHSLAQFLRNLIVDLEPEFTPNISEIAKYSRKSQAKILAELIDSLT
jgi:hypothetical protein